MVRLVNEANPQILDGYSGTLFLLARKIESLNIRTVRPKIVFGTAELINNRSRQFIENVLNAPFYDQFGCSELDRTAVLQHQLETRIGRALIGGEIGHGALVTVQVADQQLRVEVVGQSPNDPEA